MLFKMISSVNKPLILSTDRARLGDIEQAIELLFRTRPGKYYTAALCFCLSGSAEMDKSEFYRNFVVGF